MSITNYSELQVAADRWVGNADLLTLYPDFIELAHERLNRALRVRQMETDLAETDITDNEVSIPAGTVGIKTLWITGYEASPLKPQSLEYVIANGGNLPATHYAFLASSIRFNGSGAVNGVLYEQIPALSDSNTTNWLLTAHPSAYLFGTLVEAFNYRRNDKERDRWEARFQQTLAEIGGADMRDRFGGPLQSRAR